MSRHDKLINEMSLGMGSMASGVGEFAEAGDDMGPPGMDGLELGGDDDLEMDDDMGDMDDMGDDEDEMVTCSKSKLRDALERLESGECSVDECMEDICEGDDMDDDLGEFDEEDDLGGLDDEIGGVDEDSDPFAECGGGMMEDISRIASMLTDDPDIMQARKTPKPKK